MSASPLALAVLFAASVTAGAVDTPDNAAISAFVLHGKEGARTFAAVSSPGTTLEKRFVAMLERWNGKVADADGVGVFLNAAAAVAEGLIADPKVASELGVQGSNFGSAKAIERARRLTGRKISADFGSDRVPDGEPNGGTIRRGRPSTAKEQMRNVMQDSRGPNSSIGSGVPYDVLSGVVPEAANLPAANLPANFRGKTVRDMPALVYGDAGPDGASGNAANGTAATGSSGSAGAAGAADDGSAKVRDTFYETVARLVKEGKRGAGTGSTNGIMNNMNASLLPGSKRLRCFDQAEELIGDLNNKVGQGGGKKGGWTFRMATYTGEGHEANGHYWVNAVNSDPKVKTMLLDPWAGTIAYDNSKDPVVIKPFLPWLMGAGMDKVMPQ